MDRTRLTGNQKCFLIGCVGIAAMAVLGVVGALVPICVRLIQDS